jgi:hypothetical protein
MTNSPHFLEQATAILPRADNLFRAMDTRAGLGYTEPTEKPCNTARDTTS